MMQPFFSLSLWERAGVRARWCQEGDVAVLDALTRTFSHWKTEQD
jgi:hypothetical protein